MEKRFYRTYAWRNDPEEIARMNSSAYTNRMKKPGIALPGFFLFLRFAGLPAQGQPHQEPIPIPGDDPAARATEAIPPRPLLEENLGKARAVVQGTITKTQMPKGEFATTTLKITKSYRRPFHAGQMLTYHSFRPAIALSSVTPALDVDLCSNQIQISP